MRSAAVRNAVAVPSSPTMPSSGRCSRRRVAMSSSAAWSAAVTTSDTEVLRSTWTPSAHIRAASRPASRASEAASARSSTHRTLLVVEVRELLAYQVLLDLAGRRLGQLVDHDDGLGCLEPCDAA